MHCALFEKSRGPGGRLSSKRIDDGSLDLGAQFFTVRDPRFHAFLEHYAGLGSFQPWAGVFRFEQDGGSLAPFHQAERFVGTPRMSAVTRSLAEAAIAGGSALAGAADVHYRCRIERAEHRRQHWYLTTASGDGLGPFDALIITTPPLQAAALVADQPGISTAVERYRMEPCWAVACGYGQPLSLGFDAVRSGHPVLGWAARDSSKPGRETALEWWILHAQGDWSEDHRDDTPEQVIQQVSGAFAARFGVTAEPAQTLAHRWLYAKPVDEKAPGYLSYGEQALGFCGDWLNGGRVEGAFLSADALVGAWRNAGRLP